MPDKPEIIAKIKEWFDILRNIATPDSPLVVAFLAGSIAAIAISPAGRIAAFVATVRKHPDWIPEEIWWRGMLIVIAIACVILYLLIRGYGHQKLAPLIGKIVGGRLVFEVGLANKTATSQKLCYVSFAPTMIAPQPLPRVYVNVPSTNQRIELVFDKNNRCYEGTCDERVLHDDIIYTMAINRSDNHAVVNFPGQRFALVDIHDDNGEEHCQVIALCKGFHLHHDEQRDGPIPTTQVINVPPG